MNRRATNVSPLPLGNQSPDLVRGLSAIQSLQSVNTNDSRPSKNQNLPPTYPHNAADKRPGNEPLTPPIIRQQTKSLAPNQMGNSKNNFFQNMKKKQPQVIKKNMLRNMNKSVSRNNVHFLR